MRHVYRKKYMQPVREIPQVARPSWKSYLVPIGAALATAGLAYAGYENKDLIKRYGEDIYYKVKDTIDYYDTPFYARELGEESI